MCGIAGWFSENPNYNKEHDLQTLKAMASTISHRGPDGEGFYLSNHVGFAHTRLSIIDIKGGTQPMHINDETFSIIFNGEIYNYKNLKKDLIAKGCNFHTDSDTEVILHLYQIHGWKGFNLLRGMYAFAIWDRRNKVGLLVRDPVGIKPLFVSTIDKSLIFGSEAKAILRFNKFNKELDESALHQLLNFRYLPGNLTLFRGIKQIAPGTVSIWKSNGEFVEHNLDPKLTSATNSPLESLIEAVDLHCTSDVEVGCYLSGGIDSATICALTKRTGRNLRSFTVDVGDDPDEAKNAAITAKLLEIKNHCDSVPSSVDDLTSLIKHLEVPKINALQVSQLAKATSKHVKVALSGLGADELFYGYNAHRIFCKSYQLNRIIPSILSRNVANIGNFLLERVEPIQWTEAQRALNMLGASTQWSRVYGILRNLWDSPSMRIAIYGQRMLDSKLPNAFGVLDDLWPNHSDPVKSMMMFEWKNKMVNDLLWQEDRVSMAEGLEVRVPFLDVEFSSNIISMDRKELMPNGKLKGYMKKMLTNVLPQSILERPKSGFQVDAPTFVTNTLMPLVNRWLSTECINHYGLFNPQFIENILKQNPQKWLRWHFFMLYLMLTTHIWIAIFEDNQ